MFFVVKGGKGARGQIQGQPEITWKGIQAGQVNEAGCGLTQTTKSSFFT